MDAIDKLILNTELRAQTIEIKYCQRFLKITLPTYLSEERQSPISRILAISGFEKIGKDISNVFQVSCAEIYDSEEVANALSEVWQDMNLKVLVSKADLADVL